MLTLVVVLTGGRRDRRRGRRRGRRARSNQGASVRVVLTVVGVPGIILKVVRVVVIAIVDIAAVPRPHESRWTRLSCRLEAVVVRIGTGRRQQETGQGLPGRETPNDWIRSDRQTDRRTDSQTGRRHRRWGRRRGRRARNDHGVSDRVVLTVVVVTRVVMRVAMIVIVIDVVSIAAVATPVGVAVGPIVVVAPAEVVVVGDAAEETERDRAAVRMLDTGGLEGQKIRRRRRTSQRSTNDGLRKRTDQAQ